MSAPVNSRTEDGDAPFLPADPSGRENAHLLPGTVESLPQTNRRWRLCHQIS